MSDEHEIRVSVVARYGQRNEPHYVAQCRCGWQSNVMRTHDQAENEGDEHRMAVPS